ncbi:hypothetical protein ACIP5Y_06360 [Nocardia sp. NPDC088792]|uniref:hypothetical protein n=1 Tax=Nocardia sp. NPDC088792 TaxID=3364332 RepID=UPI00380AE370
MATRHAVTVLSVLPIAFVAGHPSAAVAAPPDPVLTGESQPLAPPADPHALRAGTNTVELPDWVDPAMRDQAQAALDGAEGQIATTYDGLGIPRDDGTRRIASTVIGGGLGALAGVAVSGAFALEGCAKGIAAGAVIGAIAAGAPTAGAAAIPGAAAGGAIGCLVGGAIEGAVVGVLGAAVGAGIGATIGNGLGAGSPPPPPEQPVSAPNPEPVQANPPAAPVVRAVSKTADSLAALGPDAGAAVSSLRGAIKAMPPVDPSTFGPLAAPINDLLSTVQPGL